MSHRIPKRWAALSLFLSTLLLSGCWDRVEVNDLALVTGASIDLKNGDTLELSVQVFIPRIGNGPKGLGNKGNGGGSDGASTLVRSATGVTIADALSKLQEELPRKIFWGHSDVFIIGENLAKAGIREQIDFLLRSPQPRERASVFVSKGEAKKILESITPLERSSAEVLREMSQSGIGMYVTVTDLARMLSSSTRTIAIPWIEILPEAKGGQIPFVKGTAVFKQDKMVGQIDDKLTRGILWLRNEIDKSIITFSPKETKGFVSFYPVRSSTKLIPEIDKDNWSISAEIKVEETLIQNATNLDVMKPEIVKSLEQQLEEAISKRIQLTLNQVQKKLKADIFEFADAFHREYPQEWTKIQDHWDEKFSEVDVNIAITSKIRRPGMITTGGSRPKEEVKKE